MFYTGRDLAALRRRPDGGRAGDGWTVARSARGQVAYRLPVHAPGQHL